jgi:integrase
MQSKDTFPIRIGKVSIELDKGIYLRLRFSIDTTRYVFPFGKYTDDRLKAAKATAQQIESDITFRCFDPTLEKYGKKVERPTPINNNVISEQPKEITLLEIWERYRQIREQTVSENTIKSDWARVERIFKRTEINPLYVSDCEALISEQLEWYAIGTLTKPFAMLKAAINDAIDRDFFTGKNPLTKLNPIMLPKIGQDIRAFSPLDIEAILTAFEDDRFVDVNSQYLHSHYWHYVRFRTLTGCRPSEAIALTWDDIKQKKDGTVNIVFNKAYTAGKVRNTTKTGVARIFPCNSQMIEFLDSIPKTNPTLVFPSQSSQYIHSGNFLRRYWTPIVEALVKDGLVEEYLPFYNIRHTYITQLIRQSYDIATVATWVGNSPETIMNLYGASGSGKSQVGKLASILWGCKIYSPADTFASIRNDINKNKKQLIEIYDGISDIASYRECEKNIMMIWDDIDPSILKTKPDIFRMLKIGCDRATSLISLSSGETGKNLEFDTFSPKIFSSISPIHSMNEFGELVRRMLVIYHKRSSTLPIFLDDYNWDGLGDRLKEFWDLTSAKAFIHLRSQLSKIRNRSNIDPARWIILKDFITTGLLTGIWQSHDDAFSDIRCFLDFQDKQKERLKDGLESLLTEYMIECEINGQTTIYNSNIRSRIDQWERAGMLLEKPLRGEVSKLVRARGYLLERGTWVKE